MNDGEEVAEFFSRLMFLTNHIKLCDDKIIELKFFEKVLRSLNAKLDHIVAVIEESKDLF